jgi:hypothetical protein
VKGLEIAKGSSFNFDTMESLIARELFYEGQRLASSNGSMFINNTTNPLNACWDCLHFGDPNLEKSADCADTYNYKPKMYPVAEFYNQKVWPYVSGQPHAGYQFDQYDVSLFSPNCVLTTQPRYQVGTTGFFEVRLIDNQGREFFRRINMTRIPTTRIIPDYPVQ